MYTLTHVLQIYDEIGAHKQIDEVLEILADSEYMIIPKDERRDHYAEYIRFLEPYLQYTTEETRYKLNNPKKEQAPDDNKSKYSQINHDTYEIMAQAFKQVTDQ